MQKILLLSFLSFLGLGFVWMIKPSKSEQPKYVCCDSKSIQDFSNLANDARFVATHQSPDKINYQAQGEMITFDTPDGQTANAYEIRTSANSDNYLFVFHEWWGLNEHIKSEADTYFQGLDEDVNVIAIDMYDGKIATTREDAASYMQSVSPERMGAILTGAMNYIGSDAKVATVGWCFGGGISIQSSLIAENQGVACVIYYGMPENDTEHLQNLNAPVLGIFGEQDGWINHEVVDKFESSMTEVNKPLEILWYDAVHAFANPSNPGYIKEYAEEAHQKSLEFIKLGLGV